MKTAAIVINPTKSRVKKILNSVEKTLKKHRIQYKIFEQDEGSLARILPLHKLPRYNFVVTLGGDGTLLRACRTVNIHQTPIIGVNLGTLGFITDIKISEIAATIERVIRSKQYLQKRILIDVKVWRKNKMTAHMTGLNDMVISHEAASRILSFTINIDGHKVNECRSDGIIVATPTGSTGHAMSAGGPIIYPELQNLVIIPICPHTLTNRPLLVSRKRHISISLAQSPKDEAILSVDGQRYLSVDNHCRADIAVSRYSVLLAAQDKNSYWDVLKTKLGWKGHL